MRSKGVLGLALALPFLWTPARPAESDIVWPTYDRVSYDTDSSLSCEQLARVIDHVTSDIALFRKARDRVNDIIHNQFAHDDSVGRISDRRFTPATPAGGQESYVKVHDRIAASHAIALSRLDYLKALALACKRPPAPPAQP